MQLLEWLCLETFSHAVWQGQRWHASAWHEDRAYEGRLRYFRVSKQIVSTLHVSKSVTNDDQYSCRPTTAWLPLPQSVRPPPPRFCFSGPTERSANTKNCRFAVVGNYFASTESTDHLAEPRTIVVGIINNSSNASILEIKTCSSSFRGWLDNSCLHIRVYGTPIASSAKRFRLSRSIDS
ncbi:uncharacterized protein LOC111264450 [Varroa jacobsoni]|uniref:uncharacterized protein LOC111264450 n=1 Tax=Varroa jacobsoni TaxID=62625 RepID=UPI000BF690B3|nr:uncharacterized protein LOC111264450 [Varroa jacobsoni]